MPVYVGQAQHAFYFVIWTGHVSAYMYVQVRVAQY